MDLEPGIRNNDPTLGAAYSQSIVDAFGGGLLSPLLDPKP